MKRIKYTEGQWFAVPLRGGNFGIGIIVRGQYSTRGGLGYFFGPEYAVNPTGKDTLNKKPENALLVCLFGDLGIISGEWPLILSGKPFLREEWPVPFFHKILPFPEKSAVIVEYGQNYNGVGTLPIREIKVDISDKILCLPEDGLFGSGAVEIELTRRIKKVD